MPTSTPRMLERIYHLLAMVNDVLLIPMFLMLVNQLTSMSLEVSNESLADWVINVLFLSEWLIGLYLSPSRKEYFLSISKLLDLISCLPFGPLFRSARVLRLLRVLKVVRIVTRANRYHGPAEEFVRVCALVGATVFAGAYSIEVIEPSMIANQHGGNSFSAALWWSWVTISTVGYGDLAPVTLQGRAVAAILIAFGVGVCGYITGFMMRVMSSNRAKSSLSESSQILVELQNLNAGLEQINARLELLEERSAGPEAAEVSQHSSD